jgi:hypothetical protein
VPLAIVLLLLVVTVPVVVGLMRANELFCLRVRDGGIRIVRGRIPQRLLDDIADILDAPPVTQGTLRGVSEDGRVRIYADLDLTDGQRQRLRNVLGGWTAIQVRNAPRPR